MEQKLDGHRVMLVSNVDDTKYLTRSGSEYTKGVPRGLFHGNHGIPAGFIVDGELVGDVLWAFDILHIDGNLQKLPLRERRRVLERLPTSPALQIVPQARTAQEKEALLLKAAADSYEGVVLKKRDSRYSCGHRTTDWQKVKFVVTADVVVMETQVNGKEAASFGVYNQKGKLIEVGRCSLIGKPAVKPGDVVEVRYLYANDRRAPRLFQPTLLKVRTDKKAEECLDDQLKFTNKSVMPTL